MCLNAATACLWAFWGGVEGFHEGWWHPTLAENLLMTLAYLAPAAIFVVLGLLAIRRPALGALVILGFTIWLWWWWDVMGQLAKGQILLGLVMSGVGGFFVVLWWVGRAEPRRLAYRVTWIPPLVVTLVAGAYPAYLVATRVDDGNRGERTIVGNGVTLTWAPAGPGWQRGTNWFTARRTADYLSSDGLTVEDCIQRKWRLPTREETVRSMVRHGKNAGGELREGVAVYRVQPDKETPLWNPRSEVIYWWTADEADVKNAWSIAYNGSLLARPKDKGIGTLGFRLVRR